MNDQFDLVKYIQQLNADEFLNSLDNPSPLELTIQRLEQENQEARRARQVALSTQIPYTIPGYEYPKASYPLEYLTFDDLYAQLLALEAAKLLLLLATARLYLDPLNPIYGLDVQQSAPHMAKNSLLQQKLELINQEQEALANYISDLATKSKASLAEMVAALADLKLNTLNEIEQLQALKLLVLGASAEKELLQNSLLSGLGSSLGIAAIMQLITKNPKLAMGLGIPLGLITGGGYYLSNHPELAEKMAEKGQAMYESAKPFFGKAKQFMSDKINALGKFFTSSKHLKGGTLLMPDVDSLIAIMETVKYYE